MAKITIKNSTKSPRGFYNEDGVVVTVAPGETAEADLKEAPIGFEKVSGTKSGAAAKAKADAEAKAKAEAEAQAKADAEAAAKATADGNKE